MKVSLQSAFVLHSRPFRDSSAIVNVFSRDYGRMSLLAKGIRNSRNRKRFHLEPFTSLLLSWQGRGELPVLTECEVASPTLILTGERLYCGLYGNEILMRLLPVADAHPQLFFSYQQLLQNLLIADQLEPHLRQFEMHLLEQLGYGVDFSQVAESGDLIDVGREYVFIPDYGFKPYAGEFENNSYFHCAGVHLLAINELNFEAVETRRVAKKIMRLALEPHLGSKPLNSRKLFRA